MTKKINERTSLIKDFLSKEAKADQVDSVKNFPKSVFCIIGNEFCERFSYYGMKAVLYIFLTELLYYGKSDATVIYHVFSMVCYFTPLIGAILADSWLGKFKTIFYISIIYAIGNVVISVAALPLGLHLMKILTFLGLGLIGLGTGGIKPCVAAFGGDQFEEGQEKMLQRFFSVFYLAINLGSVASTFITPVLRDDVTCFGQNCFTLAFGVPAVLMVISLIIFILGKPLYKMRPISEKNIIVSVMQCICHAISRKWCTDERTKEHWLDYAEDKYDKRLIGEIKIVLHILTLYIPIPVFWALFDQQGSRWIAQATRTDGSFFGYTIKPDQIQFLNPFLVIFLIPLFEFGVYPAFKRCHLLCKPLQRITVGGLLAASAFVVAGLLQLKIESEQPVLPPPNLSEILIINNANCESEILQPNIRLDEFGGYKWKYLPIGEKKELQIDVCDILSNYTLVPKFPVQTLMIANNKAEQDPTQFIVFEDTYAVPAFGKAEVRIAYNIEGDEDSSYFRMVGKENTYSIYTKVDKNVTEDDAHIVYVSSNGYKRMLGATDYHTVNPGVYEIFFSGDSNHSNVLIDEVELRPLGRYILSMYQYTRIQGKINLSKFAKRNGTSVHILYQVPQFVLITIGEIMFSITGLEFSYSQAPTSMKSVLQAAWLLTVAFGNLIVVVVAKLQFFKKQSWEFFMFACLMGLDMLLFAIMAMCYKYVKYTPDTKEGEDTEKSADGKNNAAYVEDTHF